MVGLHQNEAMQEARTDFAVKPMKRWNSWLIDWEANQAHKSLSLFGLLVLSVNYWAETFICSLLFRNITLHILYN